MTKNPLTDAPRDGGDNVGLHGGTPPGAGQTIVVMGPSGSGKTTVGRQLAEKLGRPFVDADDHHSPKNVAKMRGGIGLTDEDREPWLLGLRALLNTEPGTVLACSALKKRYRTLLRPEKVEVMFLLLDVPQGELARRLEARQGHYAGPNLLLSQLATLERPSDEAGVLVIDGNGAEEVVLGRALAALGFGAPTK